MKRGRWFRPGPRHRGSPPQPDRGVAPTTNATRRPPRPRAAIEADLRALPTLRTGVHTGDLRADQLFGALLARRADRLLDELLRSDIGSDGAVAGSAAVTSSSTGSGTAAGSAAVPVTGTATEFRSSPPSIHLAPGTYTLMMSDAGPATHGVELQGLGVAGQTSGTAGPAGTATLTVTLGPGTYQLWCAAGDHRGAGMRTTLRVG